MKKILALGLVIILILIFFLFRSCRKETKEPQAIIPEYRKGEMIVVYKKAPTAGVKQRIKDAVAQGIDTIGLKIRICSECDNYVELWQADDIETLIHADGVKAGTGTTRPVGEDTMAIYSVNYVSELPVDFTPVNEKYIEQAAKKRAFYTPDINPAGKDTITVAVLDTGIDNLHFNNQNYLWTNRDTDCYSEKTHGWNFVNNNSNVFDDNSGKHGTLVSHFIIREFASSPKNFIQIMSLKTHDNTGKGDLFSNICGIHYAMKKGANIINASWGFYNYNNDTYPYFDSLVTEILKEKGILFIAAAGNKIEASDSLIKVAYKNLHGVELSDDSLRNLKINNFYPAILSNPENNNVITVTTSYDENVSPTQNYSGSFVDLGAQADTINSSQMAFKLPFPANMDYLSGSSFAAAIVSGKIGAYLPKSEYKANIQKQDVLQTLSSIHGTLGISQFIFENAVLANDNLIRKGRFTK